MDVRQHATLSYSIVHRFALLMPTLAHWPRDSRNYHVFRALTLPYEIFRIYDNFPAVWLFHVIVNFFLHFLWSFLQLYQQRIIRETLQKGKILEKRFSFSSFSKFWKFRNRFGISLKKNFISYQHFRSYATFL